MNDYTDAVARMRPRYWHDGRGVISVTQALHAAGRIRNTVFYTQAAAAIESVVHKYCVEFDNHTHSTVSRGLYGFLEAYAAAVAELRLDYSAREAGVVIRPDLGVAGHLDRVVIGMHGQRRPGILTIHTRPPAPWHGPQLAGYTRLRPVGERWGLYLTETGRWRLIAYTDPMDDRRFLADLAQAQQQVATTTTTMTTTTRGDDDDVWLTPLARTTVSTAYSPPRPTRMP